MPALDGHFMPPDGRVVSRVTSLVTRANVPQAALMITDLCKKTCKQKIKHSLSAGQ